MGEWEDIMVPDREQTMKQYRQLALVILFILAEGLFAAEGGKPARKNVTPLPAKTSSSSSSAASPPSSSSPYELSGRDTAFNAIDQIIQSQWRKNNIQPADLCSDAVFLRRIYLDVAGSLPDIDEVRRFLDNPRQDKRVALINRLLAEAAYADYRTLKWCDLLRVKAEFPINLWPNAVQAYDRWIYEAMLSNMPYDRFVRMLLTSSGSNFRTPQVNFYRAIQGREPTAIASAVALTFLGERMDKWPADRREGFAAFFSRIGYKETAEWKEEIVYFNPSQNTALVAVFPDGQKVTIPADTDPREVFADWLLAADNPRLSRAIVNRIWSWLMGRGLVHEPDDMRPDNPAVYPELLDYLAGELVKAKYDLNAIYGLILKSRTYQQASIAHGDNPKAAAAFACYPIRRLEAETLIDALCRITGTRESYSSPIPEPFTFIPDDQPSIELADGSTSSSFLELFGRPARDTGLESERNNATTETQRMHMLNSSHIQNKIQNSWKLRALIAAQRGNRGGLIDSLYLTILSRYPTADERTIVQKYFGDEKSNPGQAVNDLVWALVNTKEFLYRH
jgi:hypothetical protein